jgi:hypothetical protein
MKASELRINNWYKNMSIDNPFNQIKYGHDIDYVAVYCEPIPLTEEWLLKFGFNKIVYDSEETGYSVEYNLEVNKDIFISYLDDFSCAIFASEERRSKDFGVLPKWEAIRYVHQLQNLYFALIGEELKLKEDESKTD